MGVSLFVSFDGDHIGRQVGRMSLNNDVEGIRRVSQAIDQGNEIWKSWCLTCLGEIIECGGDEGRLCIPAEHLGELEKIRHQYATAVGSTVSVGVGTRLSDADRALMAQKLRGGDGICLYTPECEKIIEEAGEKTEAQKQTESYLGKADGPSPSPGPQGPKPGSDSQATAANKPSAGGGFTPGQAPGTGDAGGGSPVGPMAEGSEHSEGEQMVQLADNTSSPEGTHAAADMEDELHGHASAQDKKDEDDKNSGDAREQARKQVIEILTQVKQLAPQLEQLRDQAPELYQAQMAMVQALIITSQGLLDPQEGDDQQGGQEQSQSSAPADTSASTEVSKSELSKADQMDPHAVLWDHLIDQGWHDQGIFHSGLNNVYHHLVNPKFYKPQIDELTGVPLKVEAAGEEYTPLAFHGDGMKHGDLLWVDKPADEATLKAYGGKAHYARHNSKVHPDIGEHKLPDFDPMKYLQESKGLTAMSTDDSNRLNAKHGVSKAEACPDGFPEKKYSLLVAKHGPWMAQKIAARAMKKLSKIELPGVAPAADQQMHGTVEGFMSGLKSMPAGTPARGKFITAHMNHPPFLRALADHPQGPKVHAMLTGFMNSRANAGFKPNTVQAVVKAEKPIAPHGQLPSEPGYVYHATNVERAHDIATQGLKTHLAHEFTDQDTWPDGATEPRSYWSEKAHAVHSFAPEEGPHAILRCRQDQHPFKRESTGDHYSTQPVPPHKLEILTEKGWQALPAWSAEPDLQKVSMPNRTRLNLPVGANRDGRVKVEHEGGKDGWVSVRAGQVLSNDGHSISSRNPGGK